MHLMADEVIESLNAIIKDYMHPFLFRVQLLDGQILLVDKTMVIPIISGILSTHPTVITIPMTIEEQRGVPDLDHNKSEESPKRVDRKPFRVSGLFSKQKPKCVPKKKQQQNGIGSVWRAMSGRGKCRPRPATPVE